MREPMGLLPTGLIENLMLPPRKWPEENITITCQKYLHVMEVYFDYFFTMVQTSDIKTLCHVSRSLLHKIHIALLR